MKDRVSVNVGYVRPDALKEELVGVKVIGGTDDKRSSKIEVINVVPSQDNLESSYYYG